MKRLFGIGFILFFNSNVFCAVPVAEAPISGVGTPVTITITSGTLTMVPSSQTSGRMGVFVDLPGGALSGVAGFFGNCTSNSVAATVRPIELSSVTASPNDTFFPIREDICLWLTALGSAGGQIIHYQEIKK